MIFDNDVVTGLVLEWKHTGDKDALAQILDGSLHLVEAIVSGFDYEHRDDLIQESLLKIQHAIKYYDPNVSSLHNYLTTVIRNICITYLSKQSKEPNIPIDIEFVGDTSRPDVMDDNVLGSMIQRNRERFPSIPVRVIDEMTEYIYYSLITRGMNKKTVGRLCEEFDCNRTLAGIIYYSTLIYLRTTYIGYAKIGEIDEEFSLIPDLRDLIGKSATNRIMLAFSGIVIRVP